MIPIVIYGYRGILTLELLNFFIYVDTVKAGDWKESFILAFTVSE